MNILEYNVFTIHDIIMTTITTRIPNDLNNSLSLIAKSMERSKSYIVHRAIESYIKEQLEDIEDAEDALVRIKSPNRKFYTSEEMKQRLEERYRAEHGL